MDRQEILDVVRSMREDLHVVLNQDPSYRSEHRWQTLKAADCLIERLETELAPIPDGELSVVNTLLKLTVDQATQLGILKASYQFMETRYPFLKEPFDSMLRAYLFKPSDKTLIDLGLDTWRMMTLLRKESIHGDNKQAGATGGPGNGSETGPVHQG